jgi:hypothetical protein
VILTLGFSYYSDPQRNQRFRLLSKGARLALLVHHNDAVREWAYDREPSLAQLDKALDEADANSWTVVDMKNNRRRVFRFD